MFEIGDFVVETRHGWGFGEVIDIYDEKCKVDLVDDVKTWFFKYELVKISKKEYDYLLEEELHFEKLINEGKITYTYMDIDEDGFDTIFGNIFNAKPKEKSINDKKIVISRFTKDLCDAIQFKENISYDPYYENMYYMKQQINSILELELGRDEINKIKTIKNHHDYLFNKLDNRKKRAYNKYCQRKLREKLQ